MAAERFTIVSGEELPKTHAMANAEIVVRRRMTGVVY